MSTQRPVDVRGGWWLGCSTGSSTQQARNTLDVEDWLDGSLLLVFPIRLFLRFLYIFIDFPFAPKLTSKVPALAYKGLEVVAVTISLIHSLLLSSHWQAHSLTLSHSFGLLAAPQTLLARSSLGPLYLLFLMSQMFFPGLSTWLTVFQPQVFVPVPPQWDLFWPCCLILPTTTLASPPVLLIFLPSSTFFLFFFLNI